MADTNKGSGGKSSGGTRKPRSRPTSAKRASTRTAAMTRQRRQAAERRAKSATDTAQKAADLAGVELSEKTAADLRDTLARGIELVMSTRDRIDEVIEDARDRRPNTPADARELVQELVERGRREANSMFHDLEQLVGRGRDAGTPQLGSARRRGSELAERALKQVEKATAKARSRAIDAADPMLERADVARRAAGVGSTFPITGYDELTAAQVRGRLAKLSPAELRKVRDYEQRHSNRKTVVNAITSRLG